MKVISIETEMYDHTICNVKNTRVYDNGEIIVNYCIGAYLYRKDGPAVIHYDKNGNITHERFVNHKDCFALNKRNIDRQKTLLLK